MMPRAMRQGCPSICPIHARAMHERTNVRTQLTHASKTTRDHLLFRNVREGLWITRIRLGVTA